MLAVGIDGTRRGWVAVALRDGAFEGAALGTLAQLIERYRDAAAFGVDVPIGLPVNAPRICDREASTRIGARRASVFMTPSRAALEAVSYPEARAVARGVTAQAYRLRDKIFEAERVVDARIHEVHPEVSFAEMAGHHLRYPKKTWAGLWERLDLLRQHGIELRPDAREAGLVAPDDMIDAAAAAWSANRIARGDAESVGDETARIWF